MRTFHPAGPAAPLQDAGLTVRGLWGWYDQRPV